MERTPMEPMIDIDERVNEVAADAAREFHRAQRAKAGAAARAHAVAETGQQFNERFDPPRRNEDEGFGDNSFTRRATAT